MFIIGHQNITDIEVTAIQNSFNLTAMPIRSDIDAFVPEFNIETFTVDILALEAASWMPVGKRVDQLVHSSS